MEQEDLGNFDEEEEEIKRIEEENEIEIRLAEIQKLIHKLNWSAHTLAEKVAKKYGKTLNDLSLKELDETIASLKKKGGEAILEKKKEEVQKAELELEPEAHKITFEDTEGDALFCLSNGNKYEISKSAKICSCDGFKPVSYTHLTLPTILLV